MSERRELAGNRPLLLTGSGHPWRVTGGAADLFLVRLAAGRPTGSRHPLGRVSAGGTLFPFPAPDGRPGEDWGVLAAGALGSEVEAVGWDRYAGGEHGAEIDAWLRSLGLPAPPDSQRTRPGLDLLHREGLRRWIERVDRDEARHRSQLDRQDAADRGRVHGALAGLAEVLVPSTVEPAAASDPLLAACRTVGRELGIELRAPAVALGTTPAPSARIETGGPKDDVPDERSPDGDPLAGQRAAVADIARASHVRWRKVRLEGTWWRTDAGPLLAFRRHDGAPLALLRHRRGYRAVDPLTGEALPVDRELAAGLDPAAVSFYRPFPRRPLAWWDLLRYGGVGLGRDVATVLVMGLLGGALSLLPPYALGKLVDSIIPAAERAQLFDLVGVLVAAALGAALYQVTSAVAMVRIETRLDATVQAAVWDRVLDLPLPFFRRFNAGDLANRALGINAIRQALSGTALTAVLAGAFALMNLGLMLYYSPALTAVAVGLVVVMALVAAAGGFVELTYQRRISDLAGRVMGKVLQVLKAIAKLRAAGGERRAFAYCADDFGTQRRLIYRARLARAAVVTTNAAAPVLASLALFGFFVLWRSGATADLTSGRFLAFLAAFGALLTASLNTASTAVDLLRVVPIYERAVPILETLPEVADDRADAGRLHGDIEVSHVHFRYDENGPAVLRDVSLHVNAGEAIAIVGPSGSGKSTLLRLLLGFDAPDSGGVYYDSHSLADLDPGSVRRQIGVVLQGGQLMGGDIFGNIVGTLPLTLDDAWRAASMAGFAEDIQAMPMGMHTLVGEGASNLSGGQRQRLMIAKALVHQPRIVFFDEATSALDNPTQAIVAESLDSLQATRILIAHRLSTIRHVDRIYVLVDGQIVEHGGYDELLEAGGPFAELARRQMA